MGRVKTGVNRNDALALPLRPIVFKRMILDLGLNQAQLSEIGAVHRSTLNVCVNRGYIPQQPANFRQVIETYLSSIPESAKWLSANGLSIGDIWTTEGSQMKNNKPKGFSGYGRPAMLPGNPEEIGIHKEVEMLTEGAMKHFKFFRNPFLNDIRDLADIYMSDEHRYIEAAMIDAARHQGFIAVIGEVGSGKSVIRKKVVAELNKDENSRILFPRMIDKTRISAPSICDAIILDVSDEQPKQRLEQKTRQVERLLIARSKAGCHVVLMIEEAHDLTVRVLKLLKRFYEIEDGYKKVMGIILIGQPELGALFNEADHYDMREVIRRCQIAEIKGLNGNLKDYLTLKFKRVKADINLSNIIDDAALKALAKKLTGRDARQKTVSRAHPLTVNNEITRAMNLAYELGVERITEDVINAL